MMIRLMYNRPAMILRYMLMEPYYLIYIQRRNVMEMRYVNETTISLKGKKRYFIQYTREKQYNINDDYYIAFRARYLTKNLTVSLELPQDIEALFVERGTTKNFMNVKNSKHHIKKVFKGVIFPRQGYIFVLKVINANS